MKRSLISCLCGFLGLGATVSHNKSQNGIEVRFSSKPDESDITFLKRNGFRWSSRNHLWYAKYSEAMLTKMQTQFSASSSSSDAPASVKPIPQPVTNEEKAEAAINKFLAKYNIDADLREKFEIAKQGFERFIKDPPKKIVLSSIELTFERSRNEYSHLPKGRKRPDYYSIVKAFDLLLNNVTAYGGNPGLFDHVSFKKKIGDLDGLYSFERWIAERPQYYVDPVYPKLAKYYSDLDQWIKDEEARWHEWSEKYVQEGKVVYSKTGQSWDDYTLHKTYSSASYNQAPDVVEIKKQYGWISQVTRIRIDRVFDKPDGTSLKDQFPDARANAYGLKKPEMKEYVYNNPGQANTMLKLKMKAKALKLKLTLN